MATPEVALGSLMGMLLQYEMQGVYATLLALARSVRDLKYLHDKVLPENCRLLRQDYLKLENAFREMYRNAAPQGGSLKPNDLAVRYLLEQAQKDWIMGRRFDLTSYYVDRLTERSRGKLLITSFLDQKRARPSDAISPEVGQTSLTGETFLADFCGCSVGTSIGEVERWFVPDYRPEMAGEPLVWVQFTTWKKSLNEPWTNHMLPCVEWAHMGPGQHVQSKGDPCSFVYFFPRDSFTARLTVSGDELIASKEFLDELAREFCDELNIPVSNFRPFAEVTL